MDLSKSIEMASATHTGMVRSHNEDSIGIDAAIGLAVLADGMGGYNAGEVASGIAVTLITKETRETVLRIRLMGRTPLPDLWRPAYCVT